MTGKPTWAGEYGVGYEDLIRSWGLDVEAFETFGSYQGDHLALLRGTQGVGLIVFGYGSCSGCDELEAITPWGDDEGDDWKPVIDFAARLRDDIHWESDRDALREWVDVHPENHWWSYDDEIAAYLNKALNTSLKVEN